MRSAEPVVVMVAANAIIDKRSGLALSASNYDQLFRLVRVAAAASTEREGPRDLAGILAKARDQDLPDTAVTWLRLAAEGMEL